MGFSGYRSYQVHVDSSASSRGHSGVRPWFGRSPMVSGDDSPSRSRFEYRDRLWEVNSGVQDPSEVCGSDIRLGGSEGFPTNTKVLRFMEVSQRFLARQSSRSAVAVGHRTLDLPREVSAWARLRMRSLQFALRVQWSSAVGSPYQPVFLWEHCLLDPQWGGEEDLLALGVPLVPASRDVPAYGHVSEFVGRTPAGLGLLRCVV